MPVPGNEKVFETAHTSPQMATMANSAIIPQIMYFFPFEAFSSSPPAVRYIITPYKKITVATRNKKGITASFKIVVMVLKIPAMSSAANASMGAKASVDTEIFAKVFLFIF